MVESPQDTTFSETTKEPVIVEITVKQLIWTIVLGLGVGVLVWGLTNLLGMYVFHPLMCKEGAMSTCGSVSQYSEIIATILASMLGLFILVRQQIFRPLLVVIACAVSLWGIIGYMVVLFPWYGVLLGAALLYGVGYGAFMWILRIRFFWLAVALVVALIVGVRLLFS